MPQRSLDLKPLYGRVALVTGVSRRQGIGYAIARELLSLGADCWLQSWVPYDETQPWGAGPDSIGQLVSSLEEPDRRIEHKSVDLADPSAPAQLVADANQALGHIDIIVVNHARSSRQTLEQLTSEELVVSFRVNAIASLLLIKEWAAQHDDSRSGGRAIIISSGQHLGPMADEIPYASSKSAVVGMIESLAHHLAPRRITVNAVNPGPTDTGWADDVAYEQVLERMPFGRWGQPADTARLIGWLCSDAGQWITGQVINSEGGFRRFG